MPLEYPSSLIEQVVTRGDEINRRGYATTEDEGWQRGMTLVTAARQGDAIEHAANQLERLADTQAALLAVMVRQADLLEQQVEATKGIEAQLTTLVLMYGMKESR